MADKKISELPSGTPLTNSVVPCSDAGGTITNKITLQSILDLETRWALLQPSTASNLSGVAGNNQVSLTWTAPSSLIAITDYIVQYSSNNGTTWTTFNDGVSSSTSSVVTGLAGGVSYVFRVAAVNGFGAGSYTSASSSITPFTVAGAPSSLSAISGNAQLSLSWTAPANNGGASITGYTVEYTPSGGSASTVNTGDTNTSYVLTGLTNGTSYTIRVAAINVAGTGSYSSSTNAIPATTPNAPTSLSATSGNSQLSLSWTAPANIGGASITGYTVEYTPSGGSASTINTGSTNTSYILTGLTNGTSYSIRVAAVNIAGTGSYSSAASNTPATTPNVPTNVIATAGNAQASLSWTAPSSNGGSLITDYIIQFSSNSGSTWTTFNDGTSSSTSATVTGLTNGTSYVFKVAAVNSVGAGNYSTPSSSVTPTGSTGAVITITSQPSWNPGGNPYYTSVGASVTGGGTLTYLWQYSYNNSSWTSYDISDQVFTSLGADTNTLDLCGLFNNSAPPFDSGGPGSDGYFRVIVSSAGATSVTSNSVTVSGPGSFCLV